jgi:phosphatidylglycerophosphatase A
LIHTASKRPDQGSPVRRGDKWILLLSQGLGVGRTRIAPGTWGSLVGLAWCLALIVSGNIWIYTLGTAAGILASVPLCTRAERILGRKDDGSIVLDEIVAMPVVYLGWIAAAWLESGQCAPSNLASAGPFWLMLGMGFVLFRIFDVVKPGPIRSLQYLEAGWGVVLDDVLAAFGAAGVLTIFQVALGLAA